SSITENTIVNLSSVELSHSDLCLLRKGLSFCPDTNHINEYQLHLDLHNFARNLRLREHFHESVSSHPTHPFRQSSSFTPFASKDVNLDVYVRAVQKDVLVQCKRKNSNAKASNLQPDEKKSLEDLQQRDDIVIKPADKGGAIVIMDTTMYKTEALRQLNDTNFYTALPSNPTASYATTITRVLKRLRKDEKIDEHLLNFITPTDCKPGRFYLLPKIHKSGNPGRPIVSSNSTVTESISSFVDYLIKVLPETFDSYIKDTTHFLQIISQLDVPQNALMVTLDVSSLYTNIPHAEGIQATITAYNRKRDKLVDPETLSKLLDLILNFNHFEFDDNHYLQINGTAMGTKMAPNYANVFMGDLEDKFLKQRKKTPLLYKRYIDDIFMIWQHDLTDLHNFITDFNQFHPTIKFTSTYSVSTINFLDVSVKLVDGVLSTTLYRKPTDSQQYLSFKSSHPRHCKTAIPYSQALRCRRICSNDDDLNKNLEQLKQAFHKRDYPTALVNNAIDRARTSDRKSMLSSRTTRNATKNPVNLTLTYNNNLPAIGSILRKHQHLLQQSDTLKKIFPDVPRVVYRRPQNIRNKLVHAKLTKPSSPKPGGCKPCKKSRCKICRQMLSANIVSSTNSNFRHAIKSDVNCDSENVIYLIECSTCKEQYIGQTKTAFRFRFNNHKADVKCKPNLPVSKHFSQPGHSIMNANVAIIQSGFKTQIDREIRESFLIHKFQCKINEDLGTLSTIHSLQNHLPYRPRPA
ncbi:unnamed protein product, partial [Ixodes hexagonus]